jgi:hypothetical protein
MGKMYGTSVTAGATTTITLATGTLPSWAVTGDQVYIYSGNNIANASYTAMTALTVIDGTHFTVPSSGIKSAYQNASGLEVIIGHLLSGMSNAFQQNCATIPPVALTQSKAAGPLGMDQAFSLDLEPAGLSSVLWFLGDTPWATAAGKDRTTTMNYIHNTLGIQHGGNYLLDYDISGTPKSGSDTIDFYATTPGETNPVQVINTKRPGTYVYPVSGICINEYCTLLGIQITTRNLYPTMGLVWVKNIKNGSAVRLPSDWDYVEIDPNPFPEGMPTSSNTTQWVKYTDDEGTWVLCMGIGSTNGQNRNIYALRFPFDDLDIDSGGTPYFGNVQYWGGPAGWITADIMQSPQSLFSQLWPSFAIQPTYGGMIDNSGDIFQRSDGMWVCVNKMFIFDFMWFATVNQDMLGPKIPNQAVFKEFWYDAGASQGSPAGFSSYGGRIHKQLTFSGKGVDDLLISYDTNATTTPSDTRTYWPVFLAVGGL